MAVNCSDVLSPINFPTSSPESPKQTHHSLFCVHSLSSTIANLSYCPRALRRAPRASSLICFVVVVVFSVLKFFAVCAAVPSRPWTPPFLSVPSPLSVLLSSACLSSSSSLSIFSSFGSLWQNELILWHSFFYFNKPIDDEGFGTVLRFPKTKYDSETFLKSYTWN